MMFKSLKKFFFNKKALIILIIFLIIISFITLGFYIGNKKEPIPAPKPSITKSPSSGTSTPRPVPYSVPLTEEQKALIEETIYSSDFVDDIPKKYPISLRFFYFEQGYRIWQNKFIMADGEILTSGESTIDLTLHSKYLDELGKMDLCTIIQTSNKNGDLGFESDVGKTKLTWRYKGMLKHRKCMGF